MMHGWKCVIQWTYLFIMYWLSSSSLCVLVLFLPIPDLEYTSSYMLESIKLAVLVYNSLCIRVTEKFYIGFLN